MKQGSPGAALGRLIPILPEAVFGLPCLMEPADPLLNLALSSDLRGWGRGKEL